MTAASPPEKAPLAHEARNRGKKADHWTPLKMDDPIHIAITVRVRRPRIAEFEPALADFAHQSLAEAGARGVQCLYPPPGSFSTEYGVMRSFASASDRDAFCE